VLKLLLDITTAQQLSEFGAASTNELCKRQTSQRARYLQYLYKYDGFMSIDGGELKLAASMP
jgi:hypothetical protein